MPASNDELRQQNAALTAALAALSASVQQHSHRDSRDTKVEIPKATREDRLAWERACLRSATQINADYLLTPQTEEEQAGRRRRTLTSSGPTTRPSTPASGSQ